MDSTSRHLVSFDTLKQDIGYAADLGRLFIEAVFRGGSKHSNHGDTARKMVSHSVEFIGKHYGEAVPIIIRLDAVFF